MMEGKGNKILTKQDLIEKYGVVNVTPYYVEKANGKICKPTICPQYRKNNGQLAYVVCQICIRNSKEHKSYSMPYGKLVYAWFNGETHADMVIDHINQNPLDCRPENLREVTNEWNTHKNKRNWKWPQTKQFKTESHEFLVKAMNIWIKKHRKPDDDEFGVQK